MHNVYVLCPVKLPDRARAVAKAWMARGYKMIFFQDHRTDPFTEEVTISGHYNGYWRAMNELARFAATLEGKFRMDACVFIGDDIEPDPSKTASEICKEYLGRFPFGQGVMQPSGDMQGVDETGLPAAGRICGSAWFGRHWIEHSYNGRGPSDDRYFHYYADESLARVAEKLGLMWWRPDLVQFHRHWSWGHTTRQEYHRETSDTWWNIDKAIFTASLAAGFPEGKLV